MCVSESASIVAFCIGLSFTCLLIVYHFAKVSPFRYSILAIGIVWVWILGMQIAEFFIWSDQNCGTLNRRATNAALILNLMQPVLVFVVFIFLNAHIVFKIISAFVVVFYIAYILYFLNNSRNFTCVKPQKNCSGLNLLWWKNANGLIYLVCLLALILLLFRPFKIAAFTSIFILLALLLSLKFYSCNQPSMWCFLVVSYPVFLAFF